MIELLAISVCVWESMKELFLIVRSKFRIACYLVTVYFWELRFYFRMLNGSKCVARNYSWIRYQEEADYVAELSKTLKSLPSYLQRLLKRKLSFIVLLRNGTDFPPMYEMDESTIGIYDGIMRIICIQTCVLKVTKEKLQFTLLHEIGHFVEHIYLYPISQKTWKKIWQMEKEKMRTIKEARTYGIGSYDIANCQEYFCSAFACYFLCRRDFQLCCPKTYAFIQNQIIVQRIRSRMI